MSSRSQDGVSSSPPVIRVTAGGDSEEYREFEFQSKFCIGRTDDCEVCIRNEFVSRAHAEVFYENDQWWIRDLESSNGTFIDGNRIELVAVPRTASIQLGTNGPTITMAVNLPAAAEPDEIVAQYMDRYLGKRADGAPVGEHTMFVRQVISKVQKKQKRRYTWIVSLLGVLVIAAAAVAWIEHRQASQQRAFAKDLFYAMKSLDVHVAQVEEMVMESGNQKGKDQIRKYAAQRRAMQADYDRYLAALKVDDPKMTAEDRLILRVARIFGECEVDIPPEFMAEIKQYIQKWRSTPKLANSIRVARENGYTPTIVKELLARGLPPEFFYLALQESGFDPFASGPQTRTGLIAKGMWQFIPDTGRKYGLKPGPLFNLRRPDTADDRDHWELATKAAAAYIKDLYSSDAQASGLLVMACYNWGEDRVLPLVRSMPLNPRERNFWQLLTKYRDKVPDQTYNYVFSITSATVIGENPRLFGFDFASPLAQKEDN
jgi:peptidoglycan lytic transglycosylase D